MLCYETSVKLDIAKDNIEFLKKKSGAERLKFLANYFLLSYDEAKYAMQSFKNDAFVVLFNIIEKNGNIEELEYIQENRNVIHPPFITIRQMDLARFKRYEDKIKSLEDRLRAIENGIIRMSDAVFDSWPVFDTSKEGDANDGA